MSFRPEKLLEKSAAGYTLSPDFIQTIADDELQGVYLELLYTGVHGFCASPYEEGLKPGDTLTETSVKKRLSILKNHSNWIRTFSCTEGNELIAKVAKSIDMKVLCGAWLSKDLEKNEIEINTLIQLCNEGYVDIAAVGNEVLYRKELTIDQLLGYINRVKEAVNGAVPVGYVDAYYEFTDHPEITEACDIILCNCYPFWEGTPIEASFYHMKSMYYQAKEAGKGKKVVITETGWPSQGTAIGQAQPNLRNFIRYFVNTQLWAHDESIDVFYFSSFDESWKVGAEGDVGAHWGVWDKNEKLKLL
jgi:exo-beta-1,3-glucanase (GH17 family)